MLTKLELKLKKVNKIKKKNIHEKVAMIFFKGRKCERE